MKRKNVQQAAKYWTVVEGVHCRLIFFKEPLSNRPKKVSLRRNRVRKRSRQSPKSPNRNPQVTFLADTTPLLSVQRYHFLFFLHSQHQSCLFMSRQFSMKKNEIFKNDGDAK